MMTFRQRRNNNKKCLQFFKPLQIEALEERAMLALTPQLVADIVPGPVSSSFSNFEVVNGVANFFSDYNYGGGLAQNLWKTDGSTAGTAIVTNLGGRSFSFGDPANVNGSLYFASESNGQYGLWKSDGTAAGTVLLKDGSGFPAPRLMGNVGSTIFFQSGGALWKSDGTTSGTVLVKGFNDLFDHGKHFRDRLYFMANDGVHGHELWTSDGTPAGTTLFSEIRPGPEKGVRSNAQMAEMNGALFFNGDGGTGSQGVWKTDGTVAGTALVKDLGSSIMHFPMNVNGTLIFFSWNAGNGNFTPWRSDGTPSGTVPLKSLRAIGVYDPNLAPVNVNGTIFFAANDGVHGTELWKTDGTVAGTVLVKDIRQTSGVFGAHGSDVSFLTNVNGTLFFVANDGLDNVELWQSDGTANGTVMVSDIKVGGGGSLPEGLRNVNGRLVFNADDGIHGRELWAVTISATGVPIALDKNFVTVVNTPQQVTLEAVDSDNDPLLYTVVNQPLHGTLTGTPPNLTYTPATGFTGPDSFTYRVNDGKQNSNLATVLITVVSAQPVARDVAFRTKANKPAPVALSATDPSNLPLTYTISSPPLHGTLSGTAPNLIYTPAANYTGPDSFTYQASNGNSTSNTATVSITVTPNHAPTISDGPIIFAFNTIPLVLTGEDADGDALTFTVLSKPKYGLLTGVAPNLTYTPAAGPELGVTLTYQASDGEALSNVAEITIIILNVRLLVYAEDGPQSRNNFAQQVFPEVPPGGSPNLVFNTVSDDPALFSQQPTIDSTGKLTFTPAPNSKGTATVTVVKKPASSGAEGESGGELDTTTSGTFTIEILQLYPLQNDRDWLDVSDDLHVSTIDAVLIIDYLNGFGAELVPLDLYPADPYIDTSGDNFISPIDAVLVINELNDDNLAAAAAEGESGPLDSPAPALEAKAPDSPRKALSPLHSDYDELIALIVSDVAQQAKRRRPL